MTRTEIVIAELKLALRDAEAHGSVCPSAAASAEAAEFLRLLAGRLPADRTIDVAVGEDGTIEITASSDATLATVDVSPSGRVTRLIMRDLRTGAVSPVTSGLSYADLAQRIEQAA